MVGETQAAEQRLLERMAQARAEHAALRRFRFFCIPIGLVSVGLLASIEIGHQVGGLAIPFSPIVAAAVASRSIAGVTAGRVAAALAVLILLYVLMAVDLNRDLLWCIGSTMSLIAACLDEASIPVWKGPTRRSADFSASAPTKHHTPTQ